MSSLTSRRSATTYLEVQVAMVMLAIATSGLYSVSVIQTKQTARLTNRVFAEFADEDAAINPSTSSWARKLGVMATVDEVPAAGIALPVDDYFVSITDNADSGSGTTKFSANSDWFDWYLWNSYPAYGHSALYHPEFAQPGAGSYCQQEITGIPSGNYEVLITHPHFNGLGSNVSYEVYDDTTLIQTVQVNQQVACQEVQLNSHGWKRIVVMPINSGTLKIRILDGPDGRSYVIADAIAVRTRKFELASVVPTLTRGATVVLEAP